MAITKLQVKQATSSENEELEVLLAREDIADWANKQSPVSLHSIIKKHGVETCADLIHVLAPSRIQEVMDLDIWSRRPGGKSDIVDLSQLLCWLKTLLEGGTDTLADFLRSLDVEYTSGVFSYFLDVQLMTSRAWVRAESGLAVEDKEVEHGDALELGIYSGAYVKLRDIGEFDEVEEIFISILEALEEHAPEFLAGVFEHMTRVESTKVLKEDFEEERELRLMSQGYVPSLKARELLLQARLSGRLRTAYFSPFRRDVENGVWEDFQKSVANSFRSDSTAIVAGGGIFPEYPLLQEFVQLLSETRSELARGFQDEFAWLANLVASGCNLEGEPVTPEAATKAAGAAANIGLELFLQGQLENVDGVVDLFEAGWRSYFMNVAMPAARELDRKIQKRTQDNVLVREAWNDFCKRRKVTQAGFCNWLRTGRYGLMQGALQDLEYALGLQTSLLARLMLDEIPRVPMQAPEWRRSLRLSQEARFMGRVNDFCYVEQLIRELD